MRNTTNLTEAGLTALVCRAIDRREKMQRDLEDMQARELATLRQIAAFTTWVDQGGPDGPALEAARRAALGHLDWIQDRMRRLDRGIKTGTLEADPCPGVLPGSLAAYSSEE